jgi:SOS-response transcriptional repressor LexA
MNEFALKIKQLRGEKTQQQLADEVGVRQSSIVHFEYGRRNPDPDTFLRLCRALRIAPEELAEYLPPDCETARLYLGRIRIAGCVPAGPAREPTDEEPLGWVHVGQQYARDKYLALQVRGRSMELPPASIPDGSIVVVERDAVPAPGDVVVAHLADVPGYTIKLFHRERGRRYLSPSSADPDHDRRELGRGDRIVGVVRMVQRTLKRREGRAGG